MMKFAVTGVVCLFANVVFAAIVLPESQIPACIEMMKPVPPKPPSPNDPTPQPQPPGPVKPPTPKPPALLEAEGPEPTSTGSAILDAALEGKAPKSLLPIWHNYPWRKMNNPKTWSAFAIQTLRDDGGVLLDTVPGDIEWYCPKYKDLNREQRLVFWARLISVIGDHESSLNPLSITWEPLVGPNVFSTGLLMLSTESTHNPVYHCEMIQNQDDLFFWRKNMTCAVRVMSTLMARDKVISWDAKATNWRGMARYWAPVRDPRMKTELGRQCLDEMLQLRRPDWAHESSLSRHPSSMDSEYRKAGEKRFEHLVRIVNELPFCQ